jgi:hypothetical protein
MVKRFDRVRASGSNTVGIVEAVVADTVLVKYPDDRKAKYKESELEKVNPVEIRLTPEKFDQAIVTEITEIGIEADGQLRDDELEHLLTVVAKISARIRERLFKDVS